MEQSSIREVLYCDEGRLLILVGPIGSIEELEAQATQREKSAASHITSPKRRAERLAWRALLRKYADKEVDICYNHLGAPDLMEPVEIGKSQYNHISVSHCRDKVAVALSSSACGIDIEMLERDFNHLIERYMTAKEQQLDNHNHLAATVWAAKEALYKIARREGVDFKRDVEIESIDFATGKIMGRIAGCGEVNMQVHLLEQRYVLVYTL